VPTKNGTALALRHVMFDDVGLISQVLQERGVKLEYVDVPSSDLTQVDALSPALLSLSDKPKRYMYVT
jgi:hypothetical protein